MSYTGGYTSCVRFPYDRTKKSINGYVASVLIELIIFEKYNYIPMTGEYKSLYSRIGPWIWNERDKDNGCKIRSNKARILLKVLEGGGANRNMEEGGCEMRGYINCRRRSRIGDGEPMMNVFGPK